jgi:hypothetical protein
MAHRGGRPKLAATRPGLRLPPGEVFLGFSFGEVSTMRHAVDSLRTVIAAVLRAKTARPADANCRCIVYSGERRELQGGS